MTKLEFPAHAWPKLRAALQYIADHPDEFYMGAYIIRKDVEWRNTISAVELDMGHPFPSCGTVACLAGRIALQDTPYAASVTSAWALGILGLDILLDDSGECFIDPVSSELDHVFQCTLIKTYAQLVQELDHRFTFPEPFPELTS